MAQFDYFRMTTGEGYWVDCQTETMAHFETRFVVPLLPLPLAPIPAAHLNPVIDVAGEAHSLVTQFAGAIPACELRTSVGSLGADRYRITSALDFLMTGM